jgi:hypothetical protein
MPWFLAIMTAGRTGTWTEEKVLKLKNAIDIKKYCSCRFRSIENQFPVDGDVADPSIDLTMGVLCAGYMGEKMETKLKKRYNTRWKSLGRSCLPVPVSNGNRSVGTDILTLTQDQPIESTNGLMDNRLIAAEGRSNERTVARIGATAALVPGRVPQQCANRLNKFL